MDIRRLEDLTVEERAALMDRRRELEEVLPRVQPIIDMVRRAGDKALDHFTRKFDGVAAASLRIPTSKLNAAWRGLPAELKAALRLAKGNIEAFHSLQVPKPLTMALGGDGANGRLGLLPRPLDRVGLYVPGGPRGYPSSVLMAAIPAVLAGVPEVALCTPPARDGWPARATLAAAHLCGVEEVYAVGGAQAIAGLALGTETIDPVDKVVGPGNLYVTAAKHLLRDVVAIDTLAGPSEVVVVADGAADPEAIAWDLIAQGEHGPDSFVLLLTPSERVASAVAQAIQGALAGDPAAASGRASLTRNEFTFLTPDLDGALAYANDLAPEHLVLHVQNPRKLLDAVPRAGALFLGGRTPVSFGDYCLGTNHILPTMGLARRASPLTVWDFVRWQSWAEVTPQGFDLLAQATMALAESEGFRAHARAVALRRRGG